MEEGVLGDPDSSAEDSFSNGLLEFPQYTRPESNDYGKVPEILLSGNHKAIAAWRLKESLKRTVETRPDLISNRNLTEEEKLIIDKIKSEENS